MDQKTTPVAFGGKLESVREFGKQIDFGKTAGDYAKHRAGFPDAFFERLATMGIIRAGMKALDLGTGTGTVARGLARSGLEVTGLDKSTALMEQAKLLDADAGVAVRYVERTAEATEFPDASLEVVTPGQCWHWFKRDEAAKEARRVLKPAAISLSATSIGWFFRAMSRMSRNPPPRIQSGVDARRSVEVLPMDRRPERGGLQANRKLQLRRGNTLLA